MAEGQQQQGVAQGAMDGRLEREREREREREQPGTPAAGYHQLSRGSSTYTTRPAGYHQCREAAPLTDPPPRGVCVAGNGAVPAHRMPLYPAPHASYAIAPTTTTSQPSTLDPRVRQPRPARGPDGSRGFSRNGGGELTQEAELTQPLTQGHASATQGHSQAFSGLTQVRPSSRRCNPNGPRMHMGCSRYMRRNPTRPNPNQPRSSAAYSPRNFQPYLTARHVAGDGEGLRRELTGSFVSRHPPVSLCTIVARAEG
jgi:hypothetical protein